MAGSASTLQELSALLERLTQEEAVLKAEYEGRLKALTANRQAVEATIQLLTPTSVVSSSPEPPPEHGTVSNVPATGDYPPKPMNEWARILRGAKQMDALRRIAQANGGILRTVEARHILLATGLAKGNPRNVGSHIYHMLVDAPDFAKHDRGMFRLIDPREIDRVHHEPASPLFDVTSDNL